MRSIENNFRGIDPKVIILSRFALALNFSWIIHEASYSLPSSRFILDHTTWAFFLSWCVRYLEAACEAISSYLTFKTLAAPTVLRNRAGARAVDLGGPNVYQEGPKFEIKHKNRCLPKRKLVGWGSQALLVPSWRRACFLFKMCITMLFQAFPYDTYVLEIMKDFFYRQADREIDRLKSRLCWY